jgi:hypothetical protein
VAIHGNMYVAFARRSASLFVYVVEPEGVARVVFVVMSIVSRFLREVVLRIILFDIRELLVRVLRTLEGRVLAG